MLTPRHTDHRRLTVCFWSSQCDSSHSFFFKIVPALLGPQTPCEFCNQFGMSPGVHPKPRSVRPACWEHKASAACVCSTCSAAAIRGLLLRTGGLGPGAEQDPGQVSGSHLYPSQVLPLGHSFQLPPAPPPPGDCGVPVGTLLPAGHKLPPLHNCSHPLQSCCPVSGNICPPRVSHLLGVYREATMVRAQASLLETAPTVSMGAFQLQAGLQMGVGACVTPRPVSFLLLQVPFASFLSYVLTYLHFSY